ncbi:hypothetical protein SAMN05428970_1400 [Agromyces sp. CF514]|uniref:hypothetical protein n=1 Tax=Agromyces sp. CF514 TaxID=1881031 RepID=UPI0008E46D44|nr:hypothetical protein [Agromyces sp. CF514]SFR72648.1 hypothetical protein SAMN05428970_1400 [Agromyces sp. CF514]
MSHPDATTAHTPIARVLGLAVGLVSLVGVLVLAFSWPTVTMDPKDLPVAIAGPEQAVTAATEAIDEQADGAVALETVDDRDAAVEAIQHRDVYGAVILGEQPEVLVASGGSLAVSQLLTGVAAQLQQGVNAQAQAAAAAAGAPAPDTIVVAVTDIVPLADTDARGTGIATAMFPLVLGGMIGGIAISLVVIGALRRVMAVVVYGAAGGLLLAWILGGWFGSLQGDYWANAAAIGLTLIAIAAPITGLVALIGRAGIAFGPVVMLLFANPLSAAAVPKEFLLAPWGAVGQWFPPGAAATLLRDLSYFPEADASFPWLVLGAWAVGGLLLSVVGHFRTAGGAESDAEAALAV